MSASTKRRRIVFALFDMWQNISISPKCVTYLFIVMPQEIRFRDESNYPDKYMVGATIIYYSIFFPYTVDEKYSEGLK